MLLLISTSDKVQVVTDAAADVEAHASWIDHAAGAYTAGRTNTASITTVATTDVVGAPAASTQRNVKHLNLRNNHASTPVTVTVQHTDGANPETLMKCTLLAGEALVFDQEGRWTHFDVNGAPYSSNSKLDVVLRVVSDVVNATTAFADVTGLTQALQSGKKYIFEAHLFHNNDANTTGSRFGYNIGAAPTASIVGTIDTVTPSVTASAHSAGVTTARDTAITAQTTGATAQRLAIISGFIQPSADGTFAIRCASEIAVANGLTVKAGSWLWIRETGN